MSEAGMFFNGMWSTKPLTWWQRLRLRGRTVFAHPDRHCGDKLIQQGVLFTVDHPVVRILSPTVRAVWAANPKNRTVISGLVNQLATAWIEMEHQYDEYWYLLPDEECRAAWETLAMPSNGASIVAQLGAVCASSRLVSANVDQFWRDEVEREYERINAAIPYCEAVIAKFNASSSEQQRLLMNLNARRLFLLTFYDF